MLENMANRPVFNALTKADEEHLIEDVGREVRAMMPQFRREPAAKTAAKKASAGIKTKKPVTKAARRKK
jgi:hypothetical protein